MIAIDPARVGGVCDIAYPCPWWYTSLVRRTPTLHVVRGYLNWRVCYRPSITLRHRIIWRRHRAIEVLIHKSSSCLSDGRPHVSMNYMGVDFYLERFRLI